MLTNVFIIVIRAQCVNVFVNLIARVFLRSYKRE
jgi:hypothetical protein